jgi:nucleoid-associated protein YgaU
MGIVGRIDMRENALWKTNQFKGPRHGDEELKEILDKMASKAHPTRKEYRVERQGETLETIAEKFYGKSSKELLIRVANGLRQTEILKAGQLLILPGVVPLDKQELDAAKREILGAVNNMRSALPDSRPSQADCLRAAVESNMDRPRKNIFKAHELLPDDREPGPSNAGNEFNTIKLCFLDGITKLREKLGLCQETKATASLNEEEKIGLKQPSEKKPSLKVQSPDTQSSCARQSSASQPTIKQSSIQPSGADNSTTQPSSAVSSTIWNYVKNAVDGGLTAAAAPSAKALFGNLVSSLDKEPRANYVVMRQNDTWESLAKRFYGDGSIAETLSAANGRLSTEQIHPGDRIIVPAVRQDEIAILDQEKPQADVPPVGARAEGTSQPGPISDAEFLMELDHLMARVQFIDVSKVAGQEKPAPFATNSNLIVGEEFTSRLEELEKRLIEV